MKDALEVARDSSAVDTNAVARHVAEAVSSVAARPVPWPHIVVENLFPDEFYDAVLMALTRAETNYKRGGHKGDRRLFHGSYEQRHEFRVGRGDPNASKDVDPILLELWDVLTSAVLFDALRQQCDDVYRERFGEFVDHPRLREYLEPTLMMTRHEEAYYLGPHTDRREKVTTCIFNFPERDDVENLGTTLYVPKERSFTSDGVLHLDPKQFTAVTTVPYRRNSALIFARTDVSFHGVEPLTKEALKGTHRFNIQFNIWDRNRRPS